MATADDIDDATDSSWEWVAEQTRHYIATGGAETADSNVPVLVLATTGHKTGEPRRNCLIYAKSGTEYVVVASKGGADHDPHWFKNLSAEPSVGIQVGSERLTARARVASAEERSRLWPMMTKIFPLYETYESKTDRQIPVVVLSPQP